MDNMDNPNEDMVSSLDSSKETAYYSYGICIVLKSSYESSSMLAASETISFLLKQAGMLLIQTINPSRLSRRGQFLSHIFTIQFL